MQKCKYAKCATKNAKDSKSAKSVISKSKQKYDL